MAEALTLFLGMTDALADGRMEALEEDRACFRVSGHQPPRALSVERP